MEAPVCLVENRKNCLHVSPEALQLLSDIRNPVVVVSIVGPYRTGKSYLMNRLAGKNSGEKDRDDPGQYPQGEHLGGKRNTPNSGVLCSSREAWIFTLAVLLSSTLVYNSIGTIDQIALDKLHFVTELSKHIKAKSSSTPGDTDSEFVCFFPNFVWSVRDFPPQLQRDGKSITEDEYLEHALKLKEGDSKKEQAFNLPRKCIRLFFPTRKCFIFYCPTTPENLCNVEQMSDDQLHKGFVEQAKTFCHYIYETSQEKTLPGGHIVTGNLLAKLAKGYVDAISSGNVPCLENEVLALVEIENRAAVQEAVACYAQLMEQSVELPTETLQELLDVHKKCEEQALKKFMAGAFKDDTRQFQAEFMEGPYAAALATTRTQPVVPMPAKTEFKTVESKKEEYCSKNELKSSEISSALLRSICENLEQNIKNDSYSRSGGYPKFVNDLPKVEKQFLETPKKGIMARKILKEFPQNKENFYTTPDYSLFPNSLLCKASATTDLDSPTDPKPVSETPSTSKDKKKKGPFHRPPVAKEEIPTPEMFLEVLKSQWLRPGSFPTPGGNERKFYNLNPTFAQALQVPEVDNLVATLASASAVITGNIASCLKAEDKKADIVLCKMFQAITWAIRASA
ncbi:PREDICTED: interferon-induced guanylate-binding protein 1-like [Thamnophis sirtalis]|uniref:Interferon-induced guanylate-binding protein 1-like n=1 Tax=Thamnophis sirtalis TaxID=35019 RepID=A0A6I9Z0T2_9SAUR|nr:PREDICTED: interferon-induced guanylate-binding protein 1-like [Thamnophis sirtalis]